MTIVTIHDWDQFIGQHPEAHLLQSSQWGVLKSTFGWLPIHFLVEQCGALVLYRKITPLFTIAYIPKGPVGNGWNKLWPEIDRYCHRNKTIFLKVEPDVFENNEDDFRESLNGFQHNAATIQPRRTVTVDLRGTEEVWLSRMKQKTRYNIHLAMKKGVYVKPSSNIQEFYALLKETGDRDGFGIHTLNYYQSAYDIFSPKEQCIILIAYFENIPLAGVMVFSQGERAWYLYGASSDRERHRMPSHLLQYEAMKWACNKGCFDYDLWGVPDADEDELEMTFDKRKDGLWGVYRFKRGFGGCIKRSLGAYDRVYNPAYYWIIQSIIR